MRFSCSNVSHALFLGGFLLCLLFQTGMVVGTDLVREEPVEVDDAYMYMQKAARFTLPPGTSFPALESLREQFSKESFDMETARSRYRGFLFVHYIYHPAYSAILAGLNSLGLEWASAFRILRYAGSILIVFATAAFLRKATSPGGAGIALALLSTTTFSGQGLLYVIPGNITLGIGLLFFARRLTSDSRYLPDLFLGLPMLVLLHKTGIMYVMATLGLFVLLPHAKLSPFKRVLFASACLCACAACLLGSRWLFGSDFSQWPDPDAASLNFTQGILLNVEASTKVMRTPALFHPPGVLLIFTLSVSLMLIRPAERSRLLTCLMVFAGICFLSLFHIMPLYPAELFSRVWIPASMLIAGIVGQGIWNVAIHFVNVFREKGQGAKPEDWPRIIAYPNILPILLLFTAAWISFSAGFGGMKTLYEQAARMIRRHPFSFDSRQAKEWKSANADASPMVLYADMHAMMYYFTHGFLELGAVFFPALDEEDLGTWVLDNPRLAAVAGLNPMRLSGSAVLGDAFLIHESGIRILFDKEDAVQECFLLVKNASYKKRMFRVLLNGVLYKKVFMNPLEERIVSVSSGQEAFQKMELLSESRRSLRLRGMKLHNCFKIRWPWGREFRFEWFAPVEGVSGTTVFRERDLCGGLGSILPLKVVDDRGMLVLAERDSTPGKTMRIE